MAAFAGDMRAVFWAASIPAALAVACIIVFVRDGGVGSPAGRPPIRMSDVKQIPAAFWLIVLVGVVFSLARFSEAFLILKANAAGLPPTLTPLVLVATNAVYALGAYPAGALSDRAPARAILGSGLLALGAADLVLAFADGLAACFVGIALWGLHMSLTQGLFTKLVADHAPEGLRGSAFGLFNVFTGLGLLAASVVAGLLWDRFGPLATFCAGAGFAAATSVLLALVPSNPPRERAQA
jgi:predicted MFS family arabinose efflux permease